MYNFKIDQMYARLKFNNNSKSRDGHYPVLHRLLNFMEDRGFEVGRDPRIQQHYKCIGKDHWYGRKGDLEFKAERYPAGFEIKFFQNIIFENRHGGEYDFDKYIKMPYLIKLLFRNELRHIKDFLQVLDCADISSPDYKLAEDKVKQHFVESWHHPQKVLDDFTLEDLDGQRIEASYNRTDRDKKELINGQVKYFRDGRTGRLFRGKAYHNINNMWWVIINHQEYRNIASFELFDSTEKDFRIRRHKRDNKPKEYLLKKEKIQAASTKELISELKRRGIKRNGLVENKNIKKCVN